MARLPNWCFHAGKLAVDALCVAVCYVLAFLARCEGSLPSGLTEVLWTTLPIVFAVKWLGLWHFGVPRLAWRSVSFREMFVLARAVFVGSGVVAVLRFAFEGAALGNRLDLIGRIPYGVILIDFLLCTMGLMGIRVLWRWRHERPAPALKAPRALLVGTGPYSVGVAKQAASCAHGQLDLVGILGENASKVGLMIYGLPVVGTIDSLAETALQQRAEQVVIPPLQHGELVRRVVSACEACGVVAKVIADPGPENGRVDLDRTKPVSIEDLLRRPPVRLGGEAVADMLCEAVVFVTGAGGSIGSQLCREVCRFRPAKLVLVERAEGNLFTIHSELIKAHPHLAIVPFLADVADGPRMDEAFARFRPHVVFHAAAHKHVPMLEWNAREAVSNNIVGSQTVADLAHEHGVRQFVMISTDKAVRPTSVMGASKRLAELYVQALAQQSATRFVTVRFGNVLGSSGSVIPIFREQIAKGGPVTVTHAEMRRYFMTIPEASQLILEAGALGRGGEIFVLDMGQPVKIVDLAHDMIRLSGLTPGRDIEVRITGVRPGEKLYEELYLDHESLERTVHPLIFVGSPAQHDADAIRERLHSLAVLAQHSANEEIRAEVRKTVAEFDATAAPEGSALASA